MPRKIDFSSSELSKGLTTAVYRKSDLNDASSAKLYPNINPASEISDLLKQQYPGQFLFSIKETSEILNLSYEFIRRHIASGSIKSIAFGDRRMISIAELTFILTNGVNNGNQTIN
jgi:excisionase family DNA binding protein